MRAGMLLLCPAADQESTPARQAHCGETGFSASQVGQGLACRKHVDTTVLLLCGTLIPQLMEDPFASPSKSMRLGGQCRCRCWVWHLAVS